MRGEKSTDHVGCPGFEDNFAFRGTKVSGSESVEKKEEKNEK